MIEPKSISENLMYSTLILTSGNHQATGFIYSTPHNNLVVIANRHFAEKTDKLDFSKTTLNDTVQSIFHLSDGTNKTVNGTVTWFLHPSEDLAFFPLEQLLNPMVPLISPLTFFLRSIDESVIPSVEKTDSLSASEDVTMVGYPSGKYDSINNYPLFRYGKTASHPAVDFEGKKLGMIDVPCLPGSSGSPVFVLNEGSYHEKTGAVVIGSRVFLLGVEVAMPTRLNIVKQIKTNPSTGAIEPDKDGHAILLDTNLVVVDDLSLGYYIKASEILKFNSVFTTLGI